MTVCVKLKKGFKHTNPKGNLDASQCGDFLYVGATDEVGLYSIRTREKLATIAVPGFAPRARCTDHRLVLIAGTKAYLYDNGDPLQPKLLDVLDVRGAVIDFNFSQDGTIAYVLCQNGLKTVKIVNTATAAKLELTSTSPFDANLDGSLLVHEPRGKNKSAVLYVSAVTHGLIHVFDISGLSGGSAESPRPVRQILNRFLPVYLTESACIPNLLVSGGIFGFMFYDISNPLKPVEVSAQESPYLNLVKFLPGTKYVANAVFGPTNKLVVGKIKVKKCRGKIISARYQPLQSVDIQFGRLPWDIEILDPPRTPCSPSRKGKGQSRFQVVVPNAYEKLVQVVGIRLS